MSASRSEALTDGVRVEVEARYSEEHSQPGSQWFFLYTIRISNESEETCQLIQAVFEASDYLLDPHSAIGVKAARDLRCDQFTPMIMLATAHPAKFPEAIAKAGIDFEPVLPHHMLDLFEREERYTVQPNELAVVQAFMAANIKA